jgi:hypothetical protein
MDCGPGSHSPAQDAWFGLLCVITTLALLLVVAWAVLVPMDLFYNGLVSVSDTDLADRVLARVMFHLGALVLPLALLNVAWMIHSVMRRVASDRQLPSAGAQRIGRGEERIAFSTTRMRPVSLSSSPCHVTSPLSR